jgi:hypothetical protein
MTRNQNDKSENCRRNYTRVQGLREITIICEGESGETVVKAPDLSAHGMFINTHRSFPQGAVLKLRFRLAVTNRIVETRCEVRYWLPGVGIGVEFIGVQPEAAEAIREELAIWERRARSVRPASRKRGYVRKRAVSKRRKRS